MNELTGNIESHKEMVRHINTLGSLYIIELNLTLNFGMNIRKKLLIPIENEIGKWMGESNVHKCNP